MRYTVVVTCAVALNCGVALAQQQPPPDRVFNLHSRADGQCPPMDWHIGVDDEAHTLNGIIAWGPNMATIARTAGSFNPTNRTFAMRAQEVGGQNHVAEITGQVREDGWLVAKVEGPGISCNDITIPWSRPNSGQNR